MSRQKVPHPGSGANDGSWAMDPLDPSDPLIRISFFVDAGLTSDPNSS
jgi:hypothetical protein